MPLKFPKVFYFSADRLDPVGLRGLCKYQMFYECNIKMYCHAMCLQIYFPDDYKRQLIPFHCQQLAHLN